MSLTEKLEACLVAHCKSYQPRPSRWECSCGGWSHKEDIDHYAHLAAKLAAVVEAERSVERRADSMDEGQVQSTQVRCENCGTTERLRWNFGIGIALCPSCLELTRSDDEEEAR
jgi:hypothetical protein